jgi:hypothetical protein
MNAAAAASFRAAAELPDRDDEPHGGPAEPEAPESTEAPVVRYSPNDAAIAVVKDELAPLIAEAPALVKTPEGYERVHKAVMRLVPMRTAIEKRRKVLKADSLEYGRRVDAESDRLKGLIGEIETPLRDALKAADEEKKREAERIVAAEKAKAEAAEKAARDAEEARLKAIREEQERKLAAEREAFEAEKARLAEEQAKRDAEARRVEAEQVAERIRLAEEKRKIEEAHRAEHERLMATKREEEEKQRAERDKIEAERRSVRLEQERLDRIKFEQEARERAAKEAAEKAEQDRIAAENAERARLAAEAEEARRVEAARPDVEKVRGYGAFLRGLVLPDVKTGAARMFVSNLSADISKLADNCEAFSVGRKKGGAAPC